MAIFAAVFRETGLRFAFTVRNLRVEDDCLKFYIKPEDGLELPNIMKWMKQVFAQRFNTADGRTGHIWGDRYWSQILEGEPEEGAGETGRETANGVCPHWGRSANGVCPHGWGKEREACFSLNFPFSPAFPPRITVAHSS
jgi:hypothetical protein